MDYLNHSTLFLLLISNSTEDKIIKEQNVIVRNVILAFLLLVFKKQKYKFSLSTYSQSNIIQSEDFEEFITHLEDNDFTLTEEFLDKNINKFKDFIQSRNPTHIWIFTNLSCSEITTRFNRLDKTIIIIPLNEISEVQPIFRNNIFIKKLDFDANYSIVKNVNLGIEEERQTMNCLKFSHFASEIYKLYYKDHCLLLKYGASTLSILISSKPNYIHDSNVLTILQICEIAKLENLVYQSCHIIYPDYENANNNFESSKDQYNGLVLSFLDYEVCGFARFEGSGKFAFILPQAKGIDSYLILKVIESTEFLPDPLSSLFINERESDNEVLQFEAFSIKGIDNDFPNKLWYKNPLNQLIILAKLVQKLPDSKKKILDLIRRLILVNQQKNLDQVMLLSYLIVCSADQIEKEPIIRSLENHVTEIISINPEFDHDKLKAAFFNIVSFSRDKESSLSLNTAKQIDTQLKLSIKEFQSAYELKEKVQNTHNPASSLDIDCSHQSEQASPFETNNKNLQLFNKPTQLNQQLIKNSKVDLLKEKRDDFDAEEEYNRDSDDQSKLDNKLSNKHESITNEINLLNQKQKELPQASINPNLNLNEVNIEPLDKIIHLRSSEKPDETFKNQANNSSIDTMVIKDSNKLESAGSDEKSKSIEIEEGEIMNHSTQNQKHTLINQDDIILVNDDPKGKSLPSLQTNTELPFKLRENRSGSTGLVTKAFTNTLYTAANVASTTKMLANKGSASFKTGRSSSIAEIPNFGAKAQTLVAENNADNPLNDNEDNQDNLVLNPSFEESIIEKNETLSEQEATKDILIKSNNKVVSMINQEQETSKDPMQKPKRKYTRRTKKALNMKDEAMADKDINPILAQKLPITPIVNPALTPKPAKSNTEGAPPAKGLLREMVENNLNLKFRFGLPSSTKKDKIKDSGNNPATKNDSNANLPQSSTTEFINNPKIVNNVILSSSKPNINPQTAEISISHGIQDNSTLRQMVQTQNTKNIIKASNPASMSQLVTAPHIPKNPIKEPTNREMHSNINLHLNTEPPEKRPYIEPNSLDQSQRHFISLYPKVESIESKEYDDSILLNKSMTATPSTRATWLPSPKLDERSDVRQNLVDPSSLPRNLSNLHQTNETFLPMPFIRNQTLFKVDPKALNAHSNNLKDTPYFDNVVPFPHSSLDMRYLHAEDKPKSEPNSFQHPFISEVPSIVNQNVNNHISTTHTTYLSNNKLHPVNNVKLPPNSQPIQPNTLPPYIHKPISLGTDGHYKNQAHNRRKLDGSELNLVKLPPSKIDNELSVRSNLKNQEKNNYSSFKLPDAAYPKKTPLDESLDKSKQGDESGNNEYHNGPKKPLISSYQTSIISQQKMASTINNSTGPKPKDDNLKNQAVNQLENTEQIVPIYQHKPLLADLQTKLHSKVNIRDNTIQVQAPKPIAIKTLNQDLANQLQQFDPKINPQLKAELSVQQLRPLLPKDDNENILGTETSKSATKKKEKRNKGANSSPTKLKASKSKSQKVNPSVSGTNPSFLTGNNNYTIFNSSQNSPANQQAADLSKQKQGYISQFTHNQMHEMGMRRSSNAPQPMQNDNVRPVNYLQNNSYIHSYQKDPSLYLRPNISHSHDIGANHRKSSVINNDTEHLTSNPNLRNNIPMNPNQINTYLDSTSQRVSINQPIHNFNQTRYQPRPPISIHNIPLSYNNTNKSTEVENSRIPIKSSEFDTMRQSYPLYSDARSSQPTNQTILAPPHILQKQSGTPVFLQVPHFEQQNSSSGNYANSVQYQNKSPLSLERNILKNSSNPGNHFMEVNEHQINPNFPSRHSKALTPHYPSQPPCSNNSYGAIPNRGRPSGGDANQVRNITLYNTNPSNYTSRMVSPDRLKVAESEANINYAREQSIKYNPSVGPRINQPSNIGYQYNVPHVFQQPSPYLNNSSHSTFLTNPTEISQQPSNSNTQDQETKSKSKGRSNLFDLLN